MDADKLLDEWTDVTSRARRPGRAPKDGRVPLAGPVFRLVGVATMALVIVAAIAVGRATAEWSVRGRRRGDLAIAGRLRLRLPRHRAKWPRPGWATGHGAIPRRGRVIGGA